METKIVELSRLRPLEKVFPRHLKNITKMIEKDKIIKCPIIVDKNTGIVLDGSHRYVFFLMKGYKTAPVDFVDYQDENIRVGTHLAHRFLINGSTNISKDEVVQRGMTGNLFPPRTTRHFFPFRKKYTLNLPLSKLEIGEPVDVKRLIADVKVEDEIKHNEGYLSEISEEIDEIITYLDEIRRTKVYLKEQIRMMHNEKKSE